MPRVVIGLVATNIGKFAGKGIHRCQIFHILLTVEGFHGETFVGSPYHFLLIIRTLEVHLNLLAPLLGRGSSKIREKLFFVICHFVFNELL